MNYKETIDFLYRATPAFEQKGGSAYKPGLERMIGMANAIGNPHKKLHCIHIGGTNGKGSVSATLASVFTAEGYKAGLFTSPHLVSFRERIRIGGVPIDEQYVVDFVTRTIPLIDEWKPSFFEITTLMAFDYFAQQEVDLAIIEVGMGGRLDSTNIIVPLLSVITNVSLDHTQFLGETLEAVAHEKAGIMKPGVPVIIGESNTKLRKVFKEEAAAKEAPIFFAANDMHCNDIEDEGRGLRVRHKRYGSFVTALGGRAQHLNTHTILSVLEVLEKNRLVRFSHEAVRQGFRDVVKTMHLLGRWQKVSSFPLIVLDTGHNLAGIEINLEQIRRESFHDLHIVFGMMADKEWEKVLKILPRKAHYYFVSPEGERALPAETLYHEARSVGLRGKAYPTVMEGFTAASVVAEPNDFIYAGGSNYLVAELLEKAFPDILKETIQA